MSQSTPCLIVFGQMWWENGKMKNLIWAVTSRVTINFTEIGPINRSQIDITCLLMKKLEDILVSLLLKFRGLFVNRFLIDVSRWWHREKRYPPKQRTHLTGAGLRVQLITYDYLPLSCLFWRYLIRNFFLKIFFGLYDSKFFLIVWRVMLKIPYPERWQ